MLSVQSNNLIEKLKNQVVCPVELALRMLGGKWRGSILYQLNGQSLRFNELKCRVQNAVIDYKDADNYLSNKVLSSHIKELVEFKLVCKKEDTLGKTCYELTENGLTIMPILIELFYWGEKQARLPSGN